MKTAALLCAALCLGLAASAQSASAAGKTLADRHLAAGLSCKACHGPDEKNPQEPTLETCTGCHTLDALVTKTQNVKPHNPHTSPHYQDKLDCTNCHVMHEDQTNFCNQCHKFDFKMP